MVGVFDSGWGGLSVLKEISKIFIVEPIIYVGDNKNIPYGDKTEMFIIDRSIEISRFLIGKGATTIVVACNTATSFALELLRKKYPNVNFVGMEPAIKPAIVDNENSGRKRKIIVLATSNTLKSNRLKKLVNKYADCKEKKAFFIYESMPEWIKLVEEGEIAGKKVEKQIENDLAKIEIKSMDTIVIACTHYSFFVPIIKKMYRNINVVDPACAVSNRVKKVYYDNSLRVGFGSSENKDEGSRLIVYTTGSKKLAERNVERLLRDKVEVKSLRL